MNWRHIPDGNQDESEGALATTSESLYDIFLGKYPGRIFSEQLGKFMSNTGKRGHLIIGLDLPELRKFIKGRNEEYTIWKIEEGKACFIYSQDKDSKSLAY